MARSAIWLAVLTVGCSPQTQPGTASGGTGGGAGAVIAGSTGQIGGSTGGGAAGSGAGTSAGGAAAGGASGAPGGCSVARHVEIPRGAIDLPGAFLTRTVSRVGERFAMVQSASAANALAIISWAGLDVEFHCADDCPSAFGNAVGVGMISDTGEARLFKLGSGGGVAWNGGPGVLGPTVLFWPQAPTVPSGMDVRRAVNRLKASKDGRRAVVALGTAYFDPNVYFAEMAPDATIVGGTQTLALEQWECLDVLATRAGAAISFMTSPDGASEIAWSVGELDAAGKVTLQTTMSLPLPQNHELRDCPQVIEGPTGYHAFFGLITYGVLITMRRASSPGAPQDVLVLTGRRGKLVGVLDDELLFENREAGSTRFVGLDASGAVARDLFVLPAVDRLQQSVFVDAEGRSFFVSYETDTDRVFEEIACPR